MGGHELRCVGVTSCVRGEGRSSIATALASIQATDYARRTALVELDIAEPSVADTFELNAAPGLREYARDGRQIEECVQWPIDSLGVVVAGTAGGSTPEMSASQLALFLKDLMEAVETVVLDLPPLNPGEGALPLLDLCDAIALVVRAGVASRSQIAAASGAIGRPAYAILNGWTSATPAWVRRLCGIGR
jgi:Mrp family chromosome partitioning ATPase